MPVEGGHAEQLTSGPYYDTKPAMSPDGTMVAFQSDRDGSEGNVFVLDLASLEIRQVTHESWADLPTWTPTGDGIVYVRRDREPWNPLPGPPRGPSPGVVRRVGLDGGEPETLSTVTSDMRSPFHLPGGM